MFFIISKILGFFAIASNLIIFLGLCGALMWRSRYARFGRALMALSLVLFALVGLSPLGNALIIPLEDRFPAWDRSRGTPDGIIALGGAVTPDVAAARGDTALNEAAERMTALVELAHRYPAARIIFSGGDASLGFGGTNEADAALLFLERMGLAPARVTAEDKSRNTIENALFTKRIAAPKPGERWLLVTSAYHMPRAVGVFRKAGFPIEPYPVDWRTRGRRDLARPFQTVGDGLRRTDTALREWVGLFVYWLAGNSTELFPRPAGAPR
jgi:uncharacterized SAM-binding protein YcdF (DUF218 family)